jgi:hypothetical protein
MGAYRQFQEALENQLVRLTLGSGIYLVFLAKSPWHRSVDEAHFFKTLILMRLLPEAFGNRYKSPPAGAVSTPPPQGIS